MNGRLACRLVLSGTIILTGLVGMVVAPALAQGSAATSTVTTPSSPTTVLGDADSAMAVVTGNSADGSPTGTVGFYECGPTTTPEPCTSTADPLPQLTGPYELFCPNTPFGDIALNDVTSSGTVPQDLSAGDSFDVTDYQSVVNLPSSEVEYVLALGYTSIAGTATVGLDMIGATPASASKTLSFSVPIPNPVPAGGVDIDVPSSPTSIGPFTSTGGAVTVSQGSDITLTLEASGSSGSDACSAYPNDILPSGVTEREPEGPAIEPVIATTGVDLVSLKSSGNDTSSATSMPFTPTVTGYWCFAGYYSGDPNYAASSDATVDGCFDVTPLILPEVPAPGGGGDFAGVSCPDAADCTGVGGDDNGEPFYATESGGSWGPATEISAPLGGGYFEGVSCSDATDCTAVGSDYNGEPIYATESGGTWGPVTEISAPLGGGYFEGVSCSDATDCTAVGSYNGEPMYATESGGSWGLVNQIDSGSGYFQGVSCSDATDCTAVGAGGYGEPIYATESGGTWGPVTEMSAPYGGYFESVSCADVTDCTAVGTDYIETDFSEPMYATESGGTWGPATEISAPGGSGQGGGFSSVDCSDATDCTAVGNAYSYYDYDSEPLFATESSGTWGPAADLSAPGDGGELAGVSCPSATGCTAAGSDDNDEPFYAVSPFAALSLTSTVAAPTNSSVLLGGSDADVATVSGNSTSGSPTGTVTFYECGPTAVATPCAVPQATEFENPVALTPAPADTATATSPSFTPTSVGYWCFSGYYSGDSNYEPSADASVDGCFDVQFLAIMSSPTSPGVLATCVKRGAYFTFTFAAAGGDGRYEWVKTSGSFPQGLTMTDNALGRIHGRCTRDAVTETFTMRVTEAMKPKAGSASASFTIAVAP